MNGYDNSIPFINYKALESMNYEDDNVAIEGLFSKNKPNNTPKSSFDPNDPFVAKMTDILNRALTRTYAVEKSPNGISQSQVINEYVTTHYPINSQFCEDVNHGAVYYFNNILINNIAMGKAIKTLKYKCTVGSVKDKYLIQWLNIVDSKTNSIIAILIGVEEKIDTVPYAAMLDWYLKR